MAFNYLVPSILSFPSGVRCCLPIPWAQVGAQLRDGSGTVVLTVNAIHEGSVVEERTRTVRFDAGRIGTLPTDLESLAAFSDDPFEQPGYIECAIRSEDGAPLFAAKHPLNFYSIYVPPHRKSYFSDNAWKYAAPPVVRQIAEYGRFADAYPAVLIDRDRDLGMSVILINPYMKDIICRVFSNDGRNPLRCRIPLMSARRVSLADFLDPSEGRWRGQIQLTANNRVVSYIVWHSLKDPLSVNDQEHLDAYRGEQTHLPATQQLRRMIGAMIGRKGASA